MDADAFTIFAGVSELFGHALKTAKILQDYIDNINSAPEEASCLLAEVTALCQTLEKLMDFLSNDYKGNFTETSALAGAMGACKVQITKLDEIIKKSKATSADDEMKKEIEKEDYHNTISILRSFTEMFQFALTVENCELLTMTSEEVLAELKARENQMEQTLKSFRLMQLPGIDALLTASKQQTEILGHVIKILELGQQTQENANRIATDEEMQSLLKWISPLDPQTKHRYLRSKRVPNTGNWFLETEEFQNWRDGSDTIKILGCYGVPGVGKTFISSLVVDHLSSRSTDDKTCVFFIYFDYQDRKDQTVYKMIDEILKQAVTASKDNNPYIIQKLLETKGRSFVIGCEKVLHVISLLLRGFDKIYICIDGLDECNERDRRLLIQYLAELSSSDRNNPLPVRLFITGCPAMEEYVKSHTAVAPVIPVAMRLEANPGDIAAYIARRIEEDKLVEMEDGFKNHIITEIASASQGMFLLPILQIEAVLDEPTIRRRRKALQDMPKDLYDAYGITLDRIKAQKQSLSNLAMKVLQWVFLATRPLSVEELRHALAVEPGDTELHRDNFVEPHLILDCCLGLVIVDESTSTVRLVHQSLHDYFQQQYDKGLLFSEGHMEIALICMTYIAFDVFNSHVKTFADTIFPHLDTHLETETCSRAINTLKSTMFTPYPFLYYAVAQWDYHFRSSRTQDPKVEDMAVALILEKYTSNIAPRYLFTPRLIHWEGFHPNFEDEFYYRIRCYREAWKWTTESFPVHVAASTGSLELFRRVAMAVNKDINKMYDLGNGVLTIAAGTGNRLLVETILDPPYNADVNVENEFGSTALLISTRYSDGEMTTMLLERDGLDVNKGNDDRQTALLMAAMSGHTKIIKMLLEHDDINVNSANDIGNTPLSYAAERGELEAVKLLLEHDGVDVNWANSLIGDTPLALAANKGREQVVKFLLEQDGIMVDMANEVEQTPLAHAATGGHTEVVKLLLATGCVDVNSSDYEGKTPLSKAAQWGHLEVVDLLLKETGIDVNKADEDGDTPLSKAAQWDRSEVVALLLQHGAAVDTRNKDGRTPLSIAAQYHRLDCVNILLEASADLNTKDDTHGRTPLIRSFHKPQRWDQWMEWIDYRNFDTLKALLSQKDVDVNWKANDGSTALSRAVELEFHEAEELLRAHGAI